VRVVGGNDKLNIGSGEIRKINCTCAGDSFEGTCFSVGQVEIVCQFRRDRVSISPDVH